MLQKHEHMWSGQLGEIIITDMTIDLVPDATPFRSPHIDPGGKGELEQTEIDKQLKAGVNEPAMS